MGTCNVEIDLDSGRRGGRLGRIPARCRALVGCEDAVVVNNGAAALLLALTALGHGREVLVSRGELVEIGGSFRVPDVVAAGGARLVEVGTTNRTRAGDYRAAATDRTAVLLSVHPSNFVVRGFVASPTRAERVAVARILGVPVVEDVGSGDLTGARGEPSVAEAVAAGVDVVVFSGDKLLGGPQSGFAVGRAEAIGRLRAHPLYRALRLDKVLLAAVEATLAEHLAGRETPVDAMLSLGEAALVARAEALREGLLAAGVDAAVRADEGATGGGARPDLALPGPVVSVRVPQVDAVARDLRLGEPAILARVADGALVLDPRTLPEEALPAVAARVAEAVVARYGAPR
jgi:L-seryl-tRNA(Ser) seleniumtransferase